jgi:hypothetical protein
MLTTFCMHNRHHLQLHGKCTMIITPKTCKGTASYCPSIRAVTSTICFFVCTCTTASAMLLRQVQPTSGHKPNNPKHVASCYTPVTAYALCSAVMYGTPSSKSCCTKQMNHTETHLSQPLHNSTITTVHRSHHRTTPRSLSLPLPGVTSL